MAEQETLRLVAQQGAQESELFRGFNPFSEYALFEALSHADHGAEDVCSIGLAGVKNWKLLRPLALA